MMTLESEKKQKRCMSADWPDMGFIQIIRNEKGRDA